jgi:hypothetical protein
MTGFQIKIIAIVTMVIDHIGAFLLPELYVLRIIGRLSFPLFAWLLATGAVHTRSMTKYMQRLLHLAFISEVPYLLIHRLHSPDSWELNIFFTLFLGLLAIYAVQKLQRMWLKVIAVSIIALVAERYSSGFSYGAYGIVSILTFYMFRKNFPLVVLLQIAAVVMFYTFRMLLSGDTLQHLYESYSISLVQPLALLSLIIIYFYNGTQGRKMQWFFYWFYPIHLTAIYAIAATFNL